MVKNPYQILGLDKKAPMVVIKAAYKALMKSSGHPDLGGSSDFAQQLNQAYQILSNEITKQQLDQSLKIEPKKQQSTCYKVQPKEPQSTCYVVCVSCGSLNSLQNPQLINQSKCYQCNQSFRKNDFREKKQSNAEKTTTKKEKINEKIAYDFFHRRMYFRAIREYNFLISKKPQKAYYYYYMIGLCYNHQSQFRESFNNFLKSIKRKHDYWEASIEAGKSLMQMRQYSEALIHFERCLHRVEFPHKIQAYIGICYYKMGKFSKTIRALLQVINTDPTFEQSVYFLALAFYQLHDFSNAKKYFLMSKFHYSNNQKIKEMIDYCYTKLV